MTGLKSCPFCRGRAENQRLGSPRQSRIDECLDCGATVESNDNANTGYAWNTRAETTADRLLRHILAENPALALPQGLPDDELELLKEMRG